MRNDWFQSEDLAPSDVAKASGLDVSSLDVGGVEGPGDPVLGEAYDLLWKEFGERGELEELDVLKKRLKWFPAVRVGGGWLRYEMIWVRAAGEIIAIRDHTAMISGKGAGVWVHLSHVWVRPSWRRTGLSAWLRAWPVRSGRECLREAGRDMGEAVTLIAEMEYPTSNPASLVRLAAYQKGGFLKVDPARVKYVQPDFRPAREIDGSGGPRPLPLVLLVRRLGGGSEPGDASGGKPAKMDGGEIRDMVSALYGMYGQGFREKDMQVVWRGFEELPSRGDEVALLPPLEGWGGDACQVQVL